MSQVGATLWVIEKARVVERGVGETKATVKKGKLRQASQFEVSHPFWWQASQFIVSSCWGHIPFVLVVQCCPSCGYVRQHLNLIALGSTIFHPDETHSLQIFAAGFCARYFNSGRRDPIPPFLAGRGAHPGGDPERPGDTRDGRVLRHPAIRIPCRPLQWRWQGEVWEEERMKSFSIPLRMEWQVQWSLASSIFGRATSYRAVKLHCACRLE